MVLPSAGPSRPKNAVASTSAPTAARFVAKQPILAPPALQSPKRAANGPADTPPSNKKSRTDAPPAERKADKESLKVRRKLRLAVYDLIKPDMFPEGAPRWWKGTTDEWAAQVVREKCWVEDPKGPIYAIKVPATGPPAPEALVPEVRRRLNEYRAANGLPLVGQQPSPMPPPPPPPVELPSLPTPAKEEELDELDLDLDLPAAAAQPAPLAPSPPRALYKALPRVGQTEAIEIDDSDSDENAPGPSPLRSTMSPPAATRPAMPTSASSDSLHCLHLPAPAPKASPAPVQAPVPAQQQQPVLSPPTVPRPSPTPQFDSSIFIAPIPPFRLQSTADSTSQYRPPARASAPVLQPSVPAPAPLTEFPKSAVPLPQRQPHLQTTFASQLDIASLPRPTQYQPNPIQYGSHAFTAADSIPFIPKYDHPSSRPLAASTPAPVSAAPPPVATTQALEATAQSIAHAHAQRLSQSAGEQPVDYARGVPLRSAQDQARSHAVARAQQQSIPPSTVGIAGHIAQVQAAQAQAVADQARMQSQGTAAVQRQRSQGGGAHQRRESMPQPGPAGQPPRNSPVVAHRSPQIGHQSPQAGHSNPFATPLTSETMPLELLSWYDALSRTARASGARLAALEDALKHRTYTASDGKSYMYTFEQLKQLASERVGLRETLDGQEKAIASFEQCWGLSRIKAAITAHNRSVNDAKLRASAGAPPQPQTNSPRLPQGQPQHRQGPSPQQPHSHGPPAHQRRTSMPNQAIGPLVALENATAQALPVATWTSLPAVRPPYRHDLSFEGAPLLQGFAEAFWAALAVTASPLDVAQATTLALRSGVYNSVWNDSDEGTIRGKRILEYLYSLWLTSRSNAPGSLFALIAAAPPPHLRQPTYVPPQANALDSSAYLASVHQAIQSNGPPSAPPAPRPSSAGPSNALSRSAGSTYPPNLNPRPPSRPTSSASTSSATQPPHRRASSGTAQADVMSRTMSSSSSRSAGDSLDCGSSGFAQAVQQAGKDEPAIRERLRQQQAAEMAVRDAQGKRFAEDLAARRDDEAAVRSRASTQTGPPVAPTVSPAMSDTLRRRQAADTAAAQAKRNADDHAERDAVEQRRVQEKAAREAQEVAARRAEQKAVLEAEMQRQADARARETAKRQAEEKRVTDERQAELQRQADVEIARRDADEKAARDAADMKRQREAQVEANRLAALNAIVSNPGFLEALQVLMAAPAEIDRIQREFEEDEQRRRAQEAMVAPE